MNIYAYLFLVAVSIGGIAAHSAPGSPVAAPRILRAAEAMWTHCIVVISSAPSDGLYLYGKCTSTCEHAVDIYLTCRQIQSSNSCYTELYLYTHARDAIYIIINSILPPPPPPPPIYPKLLMAPLISFTKCLLDKRIRRDLENFGVYNN